MVVVVVVENPLTEVKVRGRGGEICMSTTSLRQKQKCFLTVSPLKHLNARAHPLRVMGLEEEEDIIRRSHGPACFLNLRLSPPRL